MNATQRLAAMEAIFAQFPAIECKKLCSDFCNIIPMSRLEFARLKQTNPKLKSKGLAWGTRVGGTFPGRGYVIGFRIEVDSVGICPLLKDGLCSVYNHRPGICRLWGLTKKLKCPYGCEPERFLTEEEAHGFMTKIAELGV
jgi:hypothetical protein